MDTPIYFCSSIPGAYDPTTGDYAESVDMEMLKWASVTDSGTETMNLVYGEVKQGSKTVRIQGHYTQPFNHIRIGNKKYRADMSRPLRRLHVFVVSEVQ